MLLAGSAGLSATGAHAALTTFQMGMLYSGTPAFDNDDAPGHDSSASNAVIRTFDAVAYNLALASSGAQETGGRITLTIGASSLPSTYVVPGNPKIAYFDVANLPTGTAGCQSISAIPITAAQAAAGQSGVSADGQTLWCSLTDYSVRQLSFFSTIAGSAPNGATLAAPIVSYTSNQTTSATNPVAYTTGTAPAQYGLPVLTVSAAPRWDLVKANTPSGQGRMLPASGPNGEDGYVLAYSIGIRALGSRKGLEALQPTMQFTDVFTDTDFPNARVITWPMNTAAMQAGGTNFNPTPGSCGNYKSGWPHFGNTLDNAFYLANDYGTANPTATQQPYTVWKGGSCALTPAVTNGTLVAGSASFTITGTDFSLEHYPIRSGTNPAATALVNTANLDDVNNQWWVANKIIPLWVPLTDAQPDGVSRFLTNTVTTFAATSVTNAVNVEPLVSNNTVDTGLSRTTGGGMSKTARPYALSTATGGFTTPPSDPNVTGDSVINQAAPNQLFMAYMGLHNSGTEPMSNAKLCDRLDNTRSRYFGTATQANYGDASGFGFLRDRTDPAYANGNPGTIYFDKPTGVVVRFNSGNPTLVPFTVRLGVGGANTASGTWSSYNTVSNEYAAPVAGVSTNSTASCDDPGITWYSSYADVPDPSLITWMRIDFTNGLPAATSLLVYVPQQVNDTYRFDTTVNAPGSGAIAAGAVIATQSNVADTMTVNTATFTAKSPANVDITYRSADALRIFQTEFATISKTSPSHPISGQLVAAGSQVTYNLQVNLTTTGSAHATTVDIWDVLPNYMGYIPGSSTFGGTAIADPVCATSGLPITRFPTQPLAGGVTACHWTLLNQTAAATSIGNGAGNLPVLSFKAGVALTAPMATSLLNTSMVTSTANSLFLPVYGGALQGFQCNSGQSCHFGNWTLNVNTPSGMLLQKGNNKAVVQVGEDFTSDLVYASIGNPVTNTRLVDVLPFVGDGRTPASAYAGQLHLAAFLAKPVADAATTPPRAADPELVYTYTKQTPALINPDGWGNVGGGTGAGTAHDTSGTAPNTATVTSWCGELFVQANIATPGTYPNCPASLNEVTAVMAVPFYNTPAPDTRVMPANTVFAIKLPLQPVGNLAGNLYTNTFSFSAPGMVGAPVTSNSSSTKVVAPDLTLTKTANPSQAKAGDAVDFTLVVKNISTDGPFVSGTITVSDPMPAGLTLTQPVAAATGWNCDASTATTASCTYTGALPIPAGGTVGAPIVLRTTVAASPDSLAATLTNSACVSTPTAQQSVANDCGTATVTLTPQVALTKTSSAGTGPVAGSSTLTYTLLARNAGVVVADGAVLADAVPTGIDSFAWSCTSTGSAAAVFTPASGMGAVNVTIGTFPPGAAVQCVVTAQTSASLPAAVKNSATLSSAITGATCLPNDSAMPCTAEVSNASMPVLGLTKSSNGGNALVTGSTVIYTVTATNSGTVPATGASVVDAVPSGVASQTWTCTAAGGAVCPNVSGSGALNEAIATWPASGSLTYVITAQLAASGLPNTVVNNASVTAPAGTATCVTPQHASATPPCVVSVTDTVLRPKVSITKTSTAGSLLAGSSFSYIVTVRNTNAPANGTVVADSLPANVASWSWTCTASGGAVCPVTSSTAALNETIATFPAGGQVVYAITAQLAASATGTVSNTATATPAAGLGALCSPGDTAPPCVASVSNPVTALVPSVGITKTGTTGTLTAGGTFTYTVTATSNGNAPANGAVVADPLPAGIASWSWTCTASGGAVCPVASGSAALNETIATFPVGGQVVYSITAKLNVTATGTVTNTATVTPPATGVCSGSCTASVNNPIQAVPRVALTKTSAAGTLTAGSTFTYTVTAISNGGAAANGAVVADSLPAGVESWSWTCAASGGAVCPAASAPSGTAALSQTIATFPVGGQVVYTITAQLAITASGTVANTATATLPAGGLCAPADTAGPCTASVSNPVAAYNPNPVPTLSQYALVLLMLMVAALGTGAMRQRKHW